MSGNTTTTVKKLSDMDNYIFVLDGYVYQKKDGVVLPPRPRNS